MKRRRSRSKWKREARAISSGDRTLVSAASCAGSSSETFQMSIRSVGKPGGEVSWGHEVVERGFESGVEALAFIWPWSRFFVELGRRVDSTRQQAVIEMRPEHCKPSGKLAHLHGWGLPSPEGTRSKEFQAGG